VSTWVIPGAPLERGAGWRIWYSRPGHEDMASPAPVRVWRAGEPQAAEQYWEPLPDLQGLARRMGVLTVTLKTPAPGEIYQVEVTEAELAEPFRWRSLPAAISDEGVSFMLASCFWHDSDREGTYAAAARFLTKQLGREWLPAFKLLVGDQVYGDWPAEYLSGAGAVEYYAARYEDYWGDALYRDALQSTPNFLLCDDHEFWNDYPERQRHLLRTWRQADRAAHGQAALECYRRFQQCLNPGPDPWFRFAIGDVSFFVADSRSQRDSFQGLVQPPHFIQEPQWRALETWVDGLRGPGVLVLGQPVYQKDGDWKDHSLSNFAEDYGRLWWLIERSLRGNNAQRAPHDILVLSGDIHTGRFAIGRSDVADGRYGVPELIASATSMIRPGSKEVEEPNPKFTVRYPAGVEPRTRDVQVDLRRDVRLTTLANNLGLVRMAPGTNGRVRFDVSIWQVRPYDARSWWDRLLGEQPQGGAVVPLIDPPIELELR
jgi:hypothetical protein